MSLHEWMDAVCTELDLEDAIDRGQAREVVLDLARDVAHGVARPAAPVTAFLLGLAAGRSGDPKASLDELAGKVRALVPPSGPEQ
jgi:hypothetical protein